MQSTNSRSRAAVLLGTWLETGDFPDRLLDGVIHDRAFITEMVLGAVRRKRTLEWVVSQLAERPPPAQLQPLLFVGLYQLLFMDHVAPHAAVFETVEAAGRRVEPHQRRFLNAMLRRCDRERAALLAALERQSVGIRTSHPDLLVARWAERLGTEQAEQLCAWNNLPAATVLCVLPSRTTVAGLQKLLREAGVESSPHPAHPERYLVLQRGVAVPTLPGYREGHFLVQDPSGGLAVDLLAPEPGDQVLDACASPGGKMLQLADRVTERGRVEASDVHPDRLARLRENAKRAGFAQVQVCRRDARRPRTAAFDRVLLDVPCTNTGVIRRRPDARWRFSAERMYQLAKLQRSILQGGATALRKDGILVYSTCSLEEEEGPDVVRAWLKENPSFVLEEERSRVPPASGTDGAYAARLRRAR